MLKKIERIAHDFSIHEGSAYRRHTITKIDQSQMVEFLPKLERICSDKKRFIMALNIEVALHGLVPGVLITYTSNDGYCPDSGFAFTKYDHILYIRSATQELLEKLGSEDKLKAFIDKWGDYYTKNRDKVGFKIWNFLLDAIYSDRDPATEDVLSRITEIGISEIFGETPICGNFESMSKSDTESAAVLLADLINAKLCDDLVYEVKYDISRLSPSQVKIVEQYIEHVRTNCAKRDNIKSRPFSSAEGSKESLIAVYCTGRNFKGEGHVDVKISLSGLSAYVLRLPSMLNIAFASASVPSSVINSREDRVKYEGLISFIKNEYVAVTGLPGSPPVEFSDLSRIIIELPKAHKVGSDAVEEYNRLTIEALSRFV